MILHTIQGTQFHYTLLTGGAGGELERDDDTVVSDCHMEWLLVTFVELLNRALYWIRVLEHQISNTK